eukprot:COSAG06_NODE_12055_length_1427_cov_0.925564_2_plen_209_part_00
MYINHIFCMPVSLGTLASRIDPCNLPLNQLICLIGVTHTVSSYDNVQYTTLLLETEPKMKARCEKLRSFAPFYTKNHHFTKTVSGQTHRESTQKREMRFSSQANERSRAVDDPRQDAPAGILRIVLPRGPCPPPQATAAGATATAAGAGFFFFFFTAGGCQRNGAGAAIGHGIHGARLEMGARCQPVSEETGRFSSWQIKSSFDERKT